MQIGSMTTHPPEISIDTKTDQTKPEELYNFVCTSFEIHGNKSGLCLGMSTERGPNSRNNWCLGGWSKYKGRAKKYRKAEVCSYAINIPAYVSHSAD